jgi:hypothetical protein
MLKYNNRIDLTKHKDFTEKFNFKKYISTSLSENIPDYKKLWRPYKKSSYFDSFEYGKSCDRCGKSFKTPWDHRESLCIECNKDIKNSNNNRWGDESINMISKHDCLLYFVDNKEGIITKDDLNGVYTKDVFDEHIISFKKRLIKNVRSLYKLLTYIFGGV